MTSVQVSSNASYLGQDIAIRQFHLFADEPSELGGNNAGPTPFEWALAGLGSCKAMTVKMYAQRKEWPLTHVDVNLDYEKVGDHPHIQAQLTLEGTLTAEQRQRLLEVADRCPVHRLLMANVAIQTVLQPEAIAPSGVS